MGFHEFTTRSIHRPRQDTVQLRNTYETQTFGGRVSPMSFQSGPSSLDACLESLAHLPLCRVQRAFCRNVGLIPFLPLSTIGRAPSALLVQPPLSIQYYLALSLSYDSAKAPFNEHINHGIAHLLHSSIPRCLNRVGCISVCPTPQSSQRTHRCIARHSRSYDNLCFSWLPPLSLAHLIIFLFERTHGTRSVSLTFLRSLK
ncbi:hypothetical protein BU26DRAFT_29871 [Trematosphaeria pertusa]|uniref:Uncharacterized protein n=1 Tax=Trematosphaeria pertusa TaxID=390896 RepID=A0A6A6J346_9PLEO|nr:uncharacterized protein BU26DRAFT_29871 [Trematosphaeria pertusa]KAF2256811.1 hypothetical protein BU26DRAFT_29871 [Trematosphaeria pertusa]